MEQQPKSFNFHLNVSRETMTEINECPLCNSQNFSPFLQCLDHTVSAEKFHLIRCNACGFVLTSPRPADQDLGTYYKSEKYISHSGTKKGVVNKLYHTVRNLSLIKKHRILKKYTPGNSVLDYGCGTGEFLAYCQKQGMQISGYEPDAGAREKAALITGAQIKDPEAYYVLPEKVDAITMWHVLEHVPNFLDVLEMHKQNIVKEGAIVVAVPNHSSYDARKYKEHWAAFDVPRHLWHFTQNDMTRIAAKLHLEVTAVLPMIFDAFYVSMLSEQYKKGSIASAFISGIKSNFAAQKPGFGYSSQIYILKNRF